MAKAHAAHDAAKMAEQQQKTGQEEGEGQKSPSPEPEIDTEQGGVDPQTTSTQLKRPCPQEKIASQKKTKASKTSLDPITVTEGYLHDIGETMRDATVEALQHFEEQQ